MNYVSPDKKAYSELYLLFYTGPQINKTLGHKIIHFFIHQFKHLFLVLKRTSSFEYSQHMFRSINKKINF